MPSLPLKLILTPGLIATATLAGRRWGYVLSGWLVGLPLTSGAAAMPVQGASLVILRARPAN